MDGKALQGPARTDGRRTSACGQSYAVYWRGRFEATRSSTAGWFWIPVNRCSRFLPQEWPPAKI